MKLNLGCGARKEEGYINIDKNESVNPDLVLDIEQGFPYNDNSIDEIKAVDFLEHISQNKVVFVVEEIWRVLKVGGCFEHSTPSTDGRGAFQDPTHKSYWNKNSWFYYTMDEAREQIGTKAHFEIVGLQDHLTSDDLKIVHTHGVLKKIGAEQ